MKILAFGALQTLKKLQVSKALLEKSDCQIVEKGDKTMKKIVVCVLMAAVCGLSGCGSDEKVITKPVDKVAADGGTETSANEAGTTAGEEITDNGESAYSGYVFEAKGVKIEIDGKAEPFLTALGTLLLIMNLQAVRLGIWIKYIHFRGLRWILIL